MASFRRCVVCEEKFVAIRSTAKFCSGKCRQAFFRYMQHERVRLNLREGERRASMKRMRRNPIRTVRLRMSSTVVTRRNSAGDYCVKFFLEGVHQVGADYFTPDLDDAIATSIAQCRKWNGPESEGAVTEKGGGA